MQTKAKNKEAFRKRKLEPFGGKTSPPTTSTKISTR